MIRLRRTSRSEDGRFRLPHGAGVGWPRSEPRYVSSEPLAADDEDELAELAVKLDELLLARGEHVQETRGRSDAFEYREREPEPAWWKALAAAAVLWCLVLPGAMLMGGAIAEWGGWHPVAGGLAGFIAAMWFLEFSSKSP